MALRPSLWGMLVYRDDTSMVSRQWLLGTLCADILLIKSPILLHSLVR